MGKKQRKRLAEQIASISSDQPRVIVATGRYLGEGFDDERLDTLGYCVPVLDLRVGSKRCKMFTNLLDLILVKSP